MGHIPLSFLAGSTEEAADRLTTLFEAHGQGAVNSTTIRKKDSHPNASWALVSFDDAVAAKRAMGCVIKVENAAAPLLLKMAKVPNPVHSQDVQGQSGVIFNQHLTTSAGGMSGVSSPVDPTNSLVLPGSTA